MIDLATHDDVTAARLTWWRSRAIGFGVHVYVVRGVLVDSGFAAVAADIRAIVQRHHVRGAFITHGHEDHAGNIGPLVAMGVPLRMDARTLAHAKAPHAIGFYRHFTWQQMPPLRSTPLPFADDSLELVPAPGHSADHCVVWDHLTATLFAGDLFLGVKVRVAHPYENPVEQVRSLRAMIARRPRRMFCAHRGLVPDAAGALTAKADWMEATIARINALHREGCDVAEVRARVLGARGMTHWFSTGDYSPDNIVRAVLR